MRPYYRNELLFSEIYLEDITRQKEQSDASLALRVLSEYREYANLSSLRAWKESFVHEVLAVLGFSYRAESESLTFLLPSGSAQSGSPISLCYILPPNEDLNCTQLGRNWAEKTIRALREQHLNWGILTNGKTWRIYHVDEPTPYETYLEVDLDSIITHQAVEAYQIFHKFMKVENFLIQSDGKCQFDRFKQESQNKIDYIEKELANALKQREEGGKGVLSDLCMGYVEALRQASQENLQDEAVRRKIYHSAMLYMFRLLFLFYADSRDLLSEDNHILLEKVLQTSQKAAEGDLQSSETRIWQMLETIFVDIDQTYNGGLFSPQESEFTRFLSEHRIQDFYLASAVLNLTHYREKNGQQKKISYRDMSVRHLGTLYEGLLEHKLFIAVEDTEVRVSKGKVQFIPVSKGGSLRKWQYIKAGKVYFASDLSERKLSGSYFTPEDVVDYIVRNTLGEKLKALKEAFWQQTRDTLRAYRLAVDEEERSALGRLFEEQALSFVRGQVLTLSVLDPAMGSGHFLVNAANLLANFITELLNEAGIEGTLETGTAYWRRWVVENCIFGVDLNPLAVELAKLSLWILSMAKNQPLSFLNHHLKCGNSLIGVNLSEVGNYPHSTTQIRKGVYRQINWLERDINFKSIVQEVLVRSHEITGKASVTMQDVSAKKHWLEEINQLLEGYKAISNLHTHLYFEQVVNRETYQEILQNNYFNFAYSLVPPNHYFHWELEFPDRFFNSHGSHGFDIVIGNPPYADIPANTKEFFAKHYYSSNSNDVYTLFTEKLGELLVPDGYSGFVLPLSLTFSENIKNLRSFLLSFDKRGWKISSFDRIPDALFGGNVRTRSSILLGFPSSATGSSLWTTPMYRWFAKERAQLFSSINYFNVDQIIGFYEAWPKIGSERQVQILKTLFEKKRNMGMLFSKQRTDHCLYFSQTAYNWLTITRNLPPIYDLEGNPVEQTKYGILYFEEEEHAWFALSIFTSLFSYWFWLVYGDGFDVTKKWLASVPLYPSLFKPEEYAKLVILGKEIQREMEKHIVFKTNAGKKIGNYNLRLCRSITDQIDELIFEGSGLHKSDLEDIRAFCDSMIKTELDEDS